MGEAGGLKHIVSCNSVTFECKEGPSQCSVTCKDGKPACNSLTVSGLDATNTLLDASQQLDDRWSSYGTSIHRG